MPLEKPLPAETGWKEIPSPELVKWEKPGETICGILIAVGLVEIEGKKVVQYTLSLGEKTLKCLATYDLRQKITTAHRGCQIRIKYLGEDENIRGGPTNSPMKVFSVQFKGTANIHGVQVTDEDVPF